MQRRLQIQYHSDSENTEVPKMQWRITDIYEEIISEYSYGFRPGRSCHDAIRQALCYLNDGYEWVVDIDIEQFFDRVNHDKLIQILREQVNDSTTLNLIRKYLKAGVMEKGQEKATITGVPQGGPLSIVCSNIYLDKLDKELEQRGLRFTRMARNGKSDRPTKRRRS